jgi:hypothetical protein
MYEAKVVEGFVFDFGDVRHRSECISKKDHVYGHYKVGDGCATICGFRIGKVLYYGISLCSPKDDFVKALGRKIASGRLLTSRSNDQRGMMYLSDELAESVPAVVLKEAVEHHLSKMRRRPFWTQEVVMFRNSRKTGK